MEGMIIPVISVILSILCNIIYHTVVFANKFGKFEEKLNQLDIHKEEIDSLDKRVNDFKVEITNINNTLENLDKEVTIMRTETHTLLKDFRDESRESMKEFKADQKDSMVAINKTIERLADRIDKSNI